MTGSIDAVVLAGGFSKRFGTEDKLLATIDDRPLICHAMDGLEEVAETIVLTCREEQRPNLKSVIGNSVVVATDQTPDRGPAHGLEVGLAAASNRWCVVIAGDMPHLDIEVYESLRERAEESEAVVARIDGSRQPTVGLYRRNPTRRAASDVLDTGDGSLQRVLDQLDVTEVPAQAFPDPTVFNDVNTKADLATARNVSKQ